MKRVSIIILILICLNLKMHSQVSGKYCCDNNWTRIDFKSPDSLNILKPFYFGSHFPGYGEGIYHINHDSLFIDYTHKSRTNYKIISAKNAKSDSLNLFFKGAFPTGISYMNEKNTIWYVDSDLKLKIERRKDSLYIESFDFTSIVIPSIVMIDKNIAGLELYLDESFLIREKSDTFKLEIINDSEIILNQLVLKKCNCDKKSKPIY